MKIGKNAEYGVNVKNTFKITQSQKMKSLFF